MGSYGPANRVSFGCSLRQLVAGRKKPDRMRDHRPLRVRKNPRNQLGGRLPVQTLRHDGMMNATRNQSGERGDEAARVSRDSPGVSGGTPRNRPQLLRSFQRMLAPLVELILQSQALLVDFDRADRLHDTVDPRPSLELAELA